MNRLIFQLADSIGFDEIPHVEISLEEPSIFGSIARPFGCNGMEAEFAALRQAVFDGNCIERAGQRLYHELVKHPELKDYLTTALQVQTPDRYPIFVEIATGSGIESLPWETLCSPAGEFVGLDERWGLGRIVDSPAPVSQFHMFTPPLRIAAVLSCLGIPAADELRALRSATCAAPGLQIELLVIVSEEHLYDSIRAEINAGTAPGVRVELIPGQLGRLQRAVTAFKPHVLHFFCHGSTQDGPHIQLAVKSDWVLGTAANSLRIEARQIRDFTARTDDLPWLIVLNCCESAAAGAMQDLQSLALRLVYDGAAPAVVGMREPVLSDDANLLTEAFYWRLLSELSSFTAGTQAHGQDAEPLNWAQLVVEARTRLAGKHKNLTPSQAAASTREWTLPVVYMRPTPFTIRPLPAAAQAIQPLTEAEQRSARLEIEALQSLLITLPPGQAGALRDEAEQRIAFLKSRLEPS